MIVLEGVLSIDNALVLGLLAKRLPKHQQPRALTYGLVGAFVFRVVAIALASLLLKWWVVKLLGGAYLIYVALKHFFFEDKHDAHDAQAHDPLIGAALSLPGMLAALLIDDKKALAALGRESEMSPEGAPHGLPEEIAAG